MTAQDSATDNHSNQGADGSPDPNVSDSKKSDGALFGAAAPDRKTIPREKVAHGKTASVEEMAPAGGKMREVERAKKRGVGSLLFVFFAVVGLVAIAVTFIVNTILILATDDQPLWWPFVAGAVLTVLVPYTLAMTHIRHRWPWVGASFFIMLSCYMILIERLTDTSGWVLRIFLPLLAITVAAFYAIVVLLHRKANKLFVASIVFLYIAVIQQASLWVVSSAYPYEESAVSQTTQTMVSFGNAALGVCLAVVGWASTKKTKG